MKPIATYQKLRGGYYTPQPIADFLANWAIQTPDTTILEPSCGDGVILASAVQRLIQCGAKREAIYHLAQGIELDPEEAQKAAERILAINESRPANVEIGDFFTYCQAHLADDVHFDAVIGNPPFVRYQNFPENHRAIAFYLMQRAGLHPNRLTNSWVPFLVASTMLLNKKGRLAMVIPAELLQVNYAAELRYFLSQSISTQELFTPPGKRYDRIKFHHTSFFYKIPLKGWIGTSFGTSKIYRGRADDRRRERH